jgi:hypothetical protein
MWVPRGFRLLLTHCGLPDSMREAEREQGERRIFYI